MQQKQKSYFDRQTRQLPELQWGDVVRVQRGKVWQPAVVLHKHEQPRSFVVRTPDGATYRRNRKHLLKTAEAPSTLLTETRIPEPVLEAEEPPAGVIVTHTPKKITPERLNPESQSVTTRSGRQVHLPVRYKDWLWEEKHLVKIGVRMWKHTMFI